MIFGKGTNYKPTNNLIPKLKSNEHSANKKAILR